MRAAVALVLAACLLEGVKVTLRAKGDRIVAMRAKAMVVAVLLTSCASRQARVVSATAGVGALGLAGAMALAALIGPADHAAPGELTQQAVTAADQGDCARVRQLEIQIRNLSSQIHEDAFVTHPTIQRCGVVKPALPAPPD